MNSIKLYGTGWCMKSAKLRNYLQSKWISFEDFDVEADDDAAETVKELYEGKLKFPTLTYGEHFLKNPTLKELDEFIALHQLDED